MPDRVCTAIVVFHDGRRLSWKITRGYASALCLNNRYFCGFAPGDCDAREHGFRSWEVAKLWCRGFARHDRAQGVEP